MPYKEWIPGEEMLAVDINTYWSKQVVNTFPNATARSTAIPTPIIGMLTWLTDVARFEYWNGTAWRRTGAGGVLATTVQTASSGGWAGGAGGVLSPHTITVDVGIGRLIEARFVGQVAAMAGAANVIATMAIKRGGNVIQQINWSLAQANNQIPWFQSVIMTGLTGSQKFEVWGWIFSGTGAVQITAAPNAPAIFSIHDVGSA